MYQSFAARLRAAVSIGFMRGPLVSATPAVVRVTLQSELRRARSSRAALAKHHRVLETVQWPANTLVLVRVCPAAPSLLPMPANSKTLHQPPPALPSVASLLDMAHCLPVDASSTLSNLSITLCSPNFDDFKRACVSLTQQEMIHVDPPAQATTEVPALREVFPL
jgi:hypothetical protein